MRIQIQSLGPLIGLKDLVLLWLWRRLAATALIRPLAWEPPYAVGSVPRKGKKTKKMKIKKKFKNRKIEKGREKTRIK